jgi:hypothetical protein
MLLEGSISQKLLGYAKKKSFPGIFRVICDLNGKNMYDKVVAADETRRLIYICLYRISQDLPQNCRRKIDFFENVIDFSGNGRLNALSHNAVITVNHNSVRNVTAEILASKVFPGNAPYTRNDSWRKRHFLDFRRFSRFFRVFPTQTEIF